MGIKPFIRTYKRLKGDVISALDSLYARTQPLPFVPAKLTNQAHCCNSMQLASLHARVRLITD